MDDPSLPCLHGDVEPVGEYCREALSETFRRTQQDPAGTRTYGVRDVLLCWHHALLDIVHSARPTECDGLDHRDEHVDQSNAVELLRSVDDHLDDQVSSSCCGI